MGCNCKNINKVEDIDDVISNRIKSKKLSFFKKLKLSFDFIEFYFYFVSSSIFNLMLNDKLEPNIPKRLIRKYKRY